MNVFEEYIKKVLKIPYCNFKGVHPKIAYEIIVGLSLMYEMYPFFNRILSAIGDVDDLNDRLNLLEFSDSNNKESNNFYEIYETDSILWAYSLSSPLIKNDFYFQLNIYNGIKEMNLSESIPCRCGKWGIYHEFGHLLDNFLHISSSNELTKIIEGHDIKNEISEYATVDNEELVADAFAYYIFSKKKLTDLEKRLGKTEFSEINYEATPLVQEIGKLIDRRYKKFIKFRQIKFISERYNFNKRFSINKNFKPISMEHMEEEIKNLVR